MIDSPANPRVKAALRLRERGERDASGQTLVDGARESVRAIEAGVQVVEAFVCRALVNGPDGERAMERLAAARTQVTGLSVRAFERLAYGDRADGIVLVIRTPRLGLADLTLPADPLVVVTEDVEKPGNVGAILRSADAVHAHAVIAVGGTDLFNPNVVRASIGTVFSVPVATAPTAGDVAAWLRGQGVRIVAARVDARQLHVDAELRGPLAIVLGSESKGLSGAWSAPDVAGIRLPMLGAADSLNVAAAAAVLLYEAWRQRRDRSSPPESG